MIFFFFIPASAQGGTGCTSLFSLFHPVETNCCEVAIILSLFQHTLLLKPLVQLGKENSTEKTQYEKDKARGYSTASVPLLHVPIDILSFLGMS